MSGAINFFVSGEPVPQGSTRAYMIKGKPFITHSNRNLEQWRQRIATEAQAAAKEQLWVYVSRGKNHAVKIIITFFFDRPASTPKSDVYHTKRPDGDKILRACLDALTGVLYEDDSQVIDIRVRKEYAPSGQSPGARFVVEAV